MSTPILPFAVWASGTNQASIPANDNSLRNQILNGLVIDDATTAQPGSPIDGDIYILPGTHTGTQWATFDEDDLVIFTDGTWYAFAPVDGVVVNLDGSQRQWTTGGGWATFGAGAANGSDTQVQFNDAGNFGGDAGLTYNKSTDVLTVGASVVANSATLGTKELLQNSQSTAYTTVLADAGKQLLHPAADTNARTFTIAANASVAYPVGTAITFINETTQVLSIAINSDTLTLANSASSGTRSLAQNGMATAIKVTSTKWIISGAGLT